MSKTYRKTSGHTEGGTSSGRTRKKPKDLSVSDREECGEGVRVYDVYMCERVAEGRGGDGLPRGISVVIYT